MRNIIILVILCICLRVCVHDQHVLFATLKDHELLIYKLMQTVQDLRCRIERLEKEKKMKVTLVSSTANPALLCGQAAAVCTNSSSPDSALCHAVGSGHTSVLEHAVFTFKVDGLSRAALAQLTRHRLASFDVQSQRYVMIDGPELVIPDSIKQSVFYYEAKSVMDIVLTLYQQMVEAGIPCEDARYITPQAVPTELIMTMNARELLHFFSIRTCNRAQWEIRELADQMLRICRETAPEIFEHAGPGCVTGICPEKRPCGHPRERSEWNAEAI